MKLFYYNENGELIVGANPNMYSDCSELSGDCTGLWGICTGLSGDCTGFYGCCTGLTLDLDCIPDEMRWSVLDIAEIAAKLHNCGVTAHGCAAIAQAWN